MKVCPACGSRQILAPKFSVSASEAAQHFVLAEEDGRRHAELETHIIALWGGEKCVVVECVECKLGFAWPFVAGDARFYNLAYPHSDYPREKWEFSRTAKALETCETDGKRALEIGSGFGYFLDTIVPRFFTPSNVVAIEYNQTSGRRLTARGYKLVNEDIRSPRFERLHGEFDFLFMFQVLEHMDQLDRLFERLMQVAKPAADLFIAVPNALRIEFNETHDSLIDMPPNHISRWSPVSFAKMADRHGIKIIREQREPMSWGSFVRQDLVYAHMRRAQRSGSIANRLRSMRRGRIRRKLEALFALLAGPTRIPGWIEAAKLNNKLGGSHWIHLKLPA